MRHATWTLTAGYRPGLLGRVVSLHAEYYVKSGQFGPEFESQVAGGMSEFFPRLSSPLNQIWSVESAVRIEGSLSIDGQDLGENCAHLRWFIISDALRGKGAGAVLMQAAMDHVDRMGFSQTRLWTFAGLDAARTLYERNGFTLAEEYEGDRWGKTVREQLWIRPAGG